jgi:phage gp46-like protein
MSLALVWSNKRQRADILVENGSLKRDSSLESLTIVSLFTDRRADDSAGVKIEDDRRGWWGDEVASSEGQQYGSLLWFVSRGNATLEVAERVRRAAKTALVWMVEDGLLKAIDVTAEYDDEKRLILTVLRTLNDGSVETSVFEVTI